MTASTAPVAHTEPRPAAQEVTLAVAGNPNSGKSTLINAVAGTRLQVGNWPGVTVEKKEATFEHAGRQVCLVDLPGTYSLSPVVGGGDGRPRLPRPRAARRGGGRGGRHQPGAEPLPHGAAHRAGPAGGDGAQHPRRGDGQGLPHRRGDDGGAAGDPGRPHLGHPPHRPRRAPPPRARLGRQRRPASPAALRARPRSGGDRGVGGHQDPRPGRRARLPAALARPEGHRGRREGARGDRPPPRRPGRTGRAAPGGRPRRRPGGAGGRGAPRRGGRPGPRGAAQAGRGPHRRHRAHRPGGAEPVPGHPHLLRRHVGDVQAHLRRVGALRRLHRRLHQRSAQAVGGGAPGPRPARRTGWCRW